MKFTYLEPQLVTYKELKVGDRVVAHVSEYHVAMYNHHYAATIKAMTVGRVHEIDNSNVPIGVLYGEDDIIWFYEVTLFERR